MFASTSPSTLCNFLLEHKDGGVEECRKEFGQFLAAVASRNLCVNFQNPDVHAESEENQPPNRQARCTEAHAWVNSQEVCHKAFMQRRRALMSLISRKDATHTHLS
jgi:hypothetical protein